MLVTLGSLMQLILMTMQADRWYFPKYQILQQKYHMQSTQELKTDDWGVYMKDPLFLFNMFVFKLFFD